MAYESERWWCDPGAKGVMCNTCVHYLGFAKCEAFPERIPRALLDREEHDTPFPGDNGFRYEKGDNPLRKRAGR